MPNACTNCIRFHYGECRESAQQCFECGGFNHIERYCPNRNTRIKRVKGEPLAGTRAWCEKHGVQNDPILKGMVLQALKSSPGSAIYVGGVCIYHGEEKNFADTYPARGRTMQDRNASDRLRTQSPKRGGPARYRSRSPLRKLDHKRNKNRQSNPKGKLPKIYVDWDYIEHHDVELDYGDPERPSWYKADNDRPISQGRGMKHGGQRQLVQFKFPQSQDNKGKELFPLQLPPALVQPGRPALRDVSNKHQNQLNALNQGIQGSEKHLVRVSNPEPIFTVDDPYFVLGVSETATEAEIVDAYQTMIWELDLERMTQGPETTDRARNILSESIEYLNAAKRQLLGY